MTSADYRWLHLAALVVLAICATTNWRIYFKYRTLYGQNVSAREQIKRLISDGNRDGYVALWGNVIGIMVGLALLFLTFAQR